MKTLVVVCHPHIEKSVVNKRLIQELEKFPDLYEIHRLHQVYSEGVIDVEKEQMFIESFDTVILQYPLYWFNCPPFLKQWLDDVFLYGWAYGSKGNSLRDKNVGLVITAGLKEDDFNINGKMKTTMNELVSPFRSTFLYTKSNFKGYHAVYDSHNIIQNNRFEKEISQYIDFINGLSNSK